MRYIIALFILIAGLWAGETQEPLKAPEVDIFKMVKMVNRDNLPVSVMDRETGVIARSRVKVELLGHEAPIQLPYWMVKPVSVELQKKLSPEQAEILRRISTASESWSELAERYQTLQQLVKNRSKSREDLIASYQKAVAEKSGERSWPSQAKLWESRLDNSAKSLQDAQNSLLEFSRTGLVRLSNAEHQLRRVWQPIMAAYKEQAPESIKGLLAKLDEQPK